MTDPFDKLIEETREKYRVSWEKSLKKYERSCEWQDADFEWAINHGYFPPRIAIQKIIDMEAKTKILRVEYGLEVFPTKISYSKNVVKELSSAILMHPELYEILDNYKNQNQLQRFAWNIKWGFKDCLDNFRNWQGHMRGEEWDFWEILSGEWSAE